MVLGADLNKQLHAQQDHHQEQVAKIGICIHPKDVNKTLFKTPFRHYEFLLMWFTFLNDCDIFNRMINRMFGPHCIYIGTLFDDII